MTADIALTGVPPIAGKVGHFGTMGIPSEPLFPR